MVGATGVLKYSPVGAECHEIADALVSDLVVQNDLFSLSTTVRVLHHCPTGPRLHRVLDSLASVSGQGASKIWRSKLHRNIILGRGPLLNDLNRTCQHHVTHKHTGKSILSTQKLWMNRNKPVRAHASTLDNA